MHLLEIKQYLMQVKIASLASICAYFKCDAELLRDRMTHWMRKGCVRQFTKKSTCGSCTKQCGSQGVEIYELVGQY